MLDALDTSPVLRQLKLALLALVVLAVGGAFAVAPAEAGPDAADHHQLSATQADDGCATPCPGEDPAQGDCEEDCQLCSCCAAQAAVGSLSVGVVLADTPVVYAAGVLARHATPLAGVGPPIFKPPRTLSS